MPSYSNQFYIEFQQVVHAPAFDALPDIKYAHGRVYEGGNVRFRAVIMFNYPTSIQQIQQTPGFEQARGRPIYRSFVGARRALSRLPGVRDAIYTYGSYVSAPVSRARDAHLPIPRTPTSYQTPGTVTRQRFNVCTVILCSI